MVSRYDSNGTIVTSIQQMLLAVIWLGLIVGGVGSPCYFNTMCSCKPLQSNNTQVKDIACLGVPFSRLPDFPSGSSTSHIDVMDSGLEVVEPDSLASSHLLSVRLISNSITIISERAFTASSKVLRSLDLSYNRLEKFPAEALRPLKTLEWLNLHSNQISDLGGDWGGLRYTLTSLFLGENELTELPDSRDSPLASFHRLNSLNLDRNKLSHVKPSSLPPSLQTLSLSSNFLPEFPTHLIEHSKITWLYLRDNFIKTLPMYNFKHRKKMDKVDLGENIISELPIVLFNGTLAVRDLNLEYNNIKLLPAGVFEGTGLGKLTLSRNQIESVSEDAFQGLADTLEYLDLGGNQLQFIPRALASLTRLKYLYIPSNNISLIQNDSFLGFAPNLVALSLLSNSLDRIPSEALRRCTKLSHFNIGYNHIMEISEEDFEDWGGSLDTLLLMNNRMHHINAHTFRNTPKLRELSLSFNKITQIDPEAFVDLSESLESLEMSFGYLQEEFPEQVLRPLTNLLWLALDNNNFGNISETSLYTFKNLQYINLDGNKLNFIPAGLFHPSVHKSIRDIRLSYNHLVSIEPHTFSSLDEIQSIVLSGNQIRIIKTNAFKNLHMKLSVILSNNKLTTISPRSFNDITNLIKLDLQHNYLQEFSLSAFHNVTNPVYPMHLNLSTNSISNLLVAETMRPVCIHTLDLSHNRIANVPNEFLEAISVSVMVVYLSYNHISKLDEAAFGRLENLHTLRLQHNSIVTIRKRAFVGLTSLQVLDLSHNHIEQVHMEQFRSVRNLRVVDLSNNHIRSIPRDAFQNTKLERLDLSNNEFIVMPSGSLGEVGFTLRLLDISNNQIEHLDSTMFPETPLLTGLNLCNNKLSIVPDNVFTSLSGLLRLEMCSNRLRANYKELFHYLPALRVLNLAGTGLKSVPILPLPNLVSLNLSSNPVSDISIPSAQSIISVRHLFLRQCRLVTLPSNVWHRLPLLKHLDVTLNPVKVLTKESLTGLDRLEWLEMEDLPRLERIESDTLVAARRLVRLSLSTTKVGTINLAGVLALRRLRLVVTRQHLGDAFSGSLGPKLRQLEITGSELKYLGAEALRGLTSRDLALHIRDTSMEELPLGLVSKLGRVAHLSLDLRNNRFTSLSMDSLYYNRSSWEKAGTKLISGGLMLEGNPWTCDCSLMWVGLWLRRWVRESLELHTAVLGAGQAVWSAVGAASCSDPRTDRPTPLIDLGPEALSCHASALAGSSTRVTASVLSLLLIVAAPLW